MVTVFLSYSHRDERLRDELEIHLTTLRRQGAISTWHDRRIGAGEEIDREISEHLEAAQIILMLVSPYFLASDYCYDVELKRALEKHDAGEACVIPVILEPCDWKTSPLGELRATPTDGKPITKHPNMHDAFLEVVQDIRKALSAFEVNREPVTSGRQFGPTSRHQDVLPEARSSNLGIRHEFTDKERDDFLAEAFQYIKVFFENSLAELAKRSPDIDPRFYEVDSGRFTATVYTKGSRSSTCAIWLARGDLFGAGVQYSPGVGEGTNSFSESLSIVDDGHALMVRPIMSMSQFSEQKDLSMQGGAEHLWAMFIRPLQ